MPADSPAPSPSRRDFLRRSGGVLAATGALPWLHAGVHVAHSDTLRIGLIGCGGRGTGAVADALRADPQTRLTAAGDAFAERVQRSIGGLAEAGFADRVDVPPERQFTGLDAYQKVVDSDVDVVILAEPPHFRPEHLAYAVKRGKHCFVEKPVAVDAPGVRSVLATCKTAEQQGIAIVSGLCYRYEKSKRETIQRIHDGAVGDITSLEVNYLTGGLWMHKRRPEWSDMEWQLRNWLYFTWLSGDLIAEQHIHSLDKAAWAMRDRYPVAAVSLGGRQVRVDPAYGNVYDHFATIYEWDDGVRCYSHCRQQVGCHTDVSDHIVGTKGRAELMRHSITGEQPWRFDGQNDNMYQAEHDALFASIRAGKPINNGEYMCNSTMMAILGRMAAYTGKRITWEQAWASEERLGPQSYDLGPLPVEPVAMPGVTKFR
jgi:predicted dehydrogenase